jgi:hypothetical protein
MSFSLERACQQATHGDEAEAFCPDPGEKRA